VRHTAGQAGAARATALVAVFVLAALVLIGAAPIAAQAQTVTRSVVANGGAAAGNGVVIVTGTIGQPSIGPSRGAAQSADLGFWAVSGNLLDPGPGDSDGDGMSNECELRYGLDPLNPADASLDPDVDGKTNLEECLAGTNPHGFYKYYLAEGASNAFFATRLALLNPGLAPATVVTEFLPPAGGAMQVNPSTIPGRTRATQDVATLPNPPANDFSTVVESDVPLVVERTMTWDQSGYGSHAETATEAPATDWYLAEGATHGRFDLFYLLQNPGAADANVTISYLRPAHAPPIVKTYPVAAHSRRTIHVDDEDPLLAAVDVSASIHSTQKIIVERAMYLSNAGQPFAGGTAAMGVTSPGPNWFLAEGATGAFFDLYLLIANPKTTDADVRVTYLLSTGQNIVKNYTVAHESRYTISVAGEDPALASANVSMIVDSMNGVDLIVERSMWWPSPGQWYEGHAAVGAQGTATRWGLADGEIGGAGHTQTYVLIANTSAYEGSAKVTLLFEDGTSTAQTVPLQASSRVNVAVGVVFPESIGKRFGIIVDSLGATPAQIVVERAMYSDANGVTWAAGTDVLATKLP
jgi:hypothetical protein